MKLANLKENFCLTHFVFKGATKYNRKVFLFPPQKYADTEPTLETAVFQNKFTLWYIRINVYKWKTKITSYKQYLFGLLARRNTKNTRTDHQIMPLTNFKSSGCKKLFPKVCMLLVKLASMKVFYSSEICLTSLIALF